MKKIASSNPILPLDVFVPDAEAHVWDDGRIYLYGSLDEEGKMDYCSNRYHVYSSADMCSWTDHGECFNLKQVTWAPDASALYAPDCAYKDGTYYLYYCIPDGRCGVAISNNPCGPFQDVGHIVPTTSIDPAVFIDDDGTAYIYWGQFNFVRGAKLKSNMIEIEVDTITQPLSVAEHEFHEGSSVKKINGKYYYLFTDTHRHGGKATSLGYAISDHPLKGFEYKGVIIDNLGCDPETWNNHGSLQCFNGQWYIFYHRSTFGSKFSRHVCVEPIEFNPDGTINEVQMTTSGAAPYIEARDTIPACRACKLSGNVRIASDNDCDFRFALCEISPGDTACYRYLKFNRETSFSITLKANGNTQTAVYIDDELITSAHFEACDAHTTVTAKLPEITGIHSLTLKFKGDFTSASISHFSFD